MSADAETQIAEASPPPAPRLMAPFVLTESDARAAALAWLGARWLTPWTFVRQARRDPLAASYVPSWMFSAHAVAHWEGPGLRGIVEMDFGGLPVSADPAADTLPESLAPWPAHTLRAVEGDVPQADDRPRGRATRDVADAATLAHQRMERDLIATARASQPAKQRDKLRLLGVEYPRETAALALLPVWALDCVHLGRSHRIAINGTTGRVSGRVPASVTRIAVVAAALLALLAAVAWRALADA